MYFDVIYKHMLMSINIPISLSTVGIKQMRGQFSCSRCLLPYNTHPHLCFALVPWPLAWLYSDGVFFPLPNSHGVAEHMADLLREPIPSAQALGIHWGFLEKALDPLVQFSFVEVLCGSYPATSLSPCSQQQNFPKESCPQA